jgi:pimeloyl-ACP methyl ester carboxylesterase
MLSKPVSDEFIIAGDVTLHYVQWGEQGPPIVCVHGLTANAFCFQSYADELASDHRVIAYDLRGRGDSDKLEDGYSIPIHTDDLSELIDELGLERPIIIGHSLGALIALNFAAQYPDKLSKLVLVDAGAPLPWKTPAEQPLWLTTAISRLGVPVASYDEYIARLKAAPFLGPYWNEYVDLYFKHDVYPNSDGTVASKAYREAIIEEGEHFNDINPAELWSRVQVPTLLLRAGQGLLSDDDQLLPEQDATQMQQTIPDCRFVEFPTLNHYTILFGVEQGPIEVIHAFLNES